MPGYTYILHIRLNCLHLWIRVYNSQGTNLIEVFDMRVTHLF